MPTGVGVELIAAAAMVGLLIAAYVVGRARRPDRSARRRRKTPTRRGGRR